jgi:GT2 family glycosyltransferase
MPLEPRPTAPQDAGHNAVGVVAIGRNEGPRLRRCLRSVLRAAAQVVYVDSGSSDGSVELARQFGAQVVELDLTIPFTAARARNAGFAALRSRADVEWVQFVDGDCELAPGWLDSAAAFLREQAQVAAVSGRLRERHPEASVYNRLCDDEWNTPIGEALHSGGNVMLRASALAAAGGFREDLIAGEEPELCVRLRRAGWKIWRIDAEMALHDAALTRFSQWWQRVRRGGHAFAEGAHLHGVSPERHWVHEARRAWFWGLALPLGLVAASAAYAPAALGFLVYPVQVLRIARRMHGPARWRWARAGFLVLGKFAEAIGLVEFHWRRLRGGRARLIEYK